MSPSWDDWFSPCLSCLAETLYDGRDHILFTSLSLVPGVIVGIHALAKGLNDRSCNPTFSFYRSLEEIWDHMVENCPESVSLNSYLLVCSHLSCCYSLHLSCHHKVKFFSLFFSTLNFKQFQFKISCFLAIILLYFLNIS